MKKMKTALIILITVFLSVSHVFAELSGRKALIAEAPLNVAVFKWFVFAILLIGLIRIVLRIRN